MERVRPVCRICLNISIDYIGFQSRFECHDNPSESSSNDITYLQCLRLCTNLPLEEDDGGPQCLCAECEDELQIVYKFLQKAQNSHAILEENKFNHESFQHTEISIEKYDPEDSISTYAFDDSEHLVMENSMSGCDDFLNDCNEISSYSFERNETLDLIEDNDVNATEETINESADNEFLQQIEHISNDAEVSHVFIPKKFKCNICNRFYTTERLLKVHLYYHKRRNVDSKPYSCKICGETFSLQRYLTQHKIDHQDCREIHKCLYCDKEYVTKTALISHKRIHQGEVLNCTECGKQFNGSYEFNVHLRFHKREKEQGIHKCEICNKSYSLPRSLSQHMVVHLRDRKIHKCSYCNKEYISKSVLNNHKRLHEGQTIKCNECGKEFTRNCELKNHMRFHKREHLFKCTMCDKEFTIKGHLRTHMWQHKGVKLKCEECGKLFGSTKAFNEHSYTHGEMPFPCKFCDKAYPSKQKYKIHLQKMHCNGVEHEINLSQIETTPHTEILEVRKIITKAAANKIEHV